MRGFAELETIRTVARRHGFISHAEIVDRVIARCASNPDGVWRAIDNDDFWGGSGSLADLSFRPYTLLPDHEVATDEHLWREAFINLEAGMRAHGIANPRAATKVEAFRAFLVADFRVRSQRS